MDTSLAIRFIPAFGQPLACNIFRQDGFFDLNLLRNIGNRFLSAISHCRNAIDILSGLCIGIAEHIGAVTLHCHNVYFSSLFPVAGTGFATFNHITACAASGQPADLLCALCIQYGWFIYGRIDTLPLIAVGAHRCVYGVNNRPKLACHINQRHRVGHIAATVHPIKCAAVAARF